MTIGELIVAAIFIAGMIGFLYYAYVIAPQRLQKKAQQIAISELAQEKLENERRAAMSPAQRAREDQERERNRLAVQEQKMKEERARKERELENWYGKLVPSLVCPHCQSKGTVRRTDATRVTKTRVNSVVGKAVGLGTNTEHKVKQLRCDSCEMKWDVA